MNKHVLISGGTGFVGRELVRVLLDAGHTVTVLTRDPARAADRMPLRCRLRAWNPSQPLEREALSGVHAVVNLAGEGIADARWTPARKQAIRESRIVGTRSLVEGRAALSVNERPKAFISASAIGYYGDRGSEELDESSPGGEGFLADVCRDWEREAIAAKTLGMRTAVVRIGIVLGKEGGALQKMLPLFRLGLGGRLGSGRQWMSWIHLEDLVQLFRFVIEHEEAEGIINGTAPVAVTNETFTRELANILGRPALLPAPAFALRLALGDMAVVMLASQRVVPCAAKRLGFVFHHGRLASALGDLCQDAAHEVEYEQWVPGAPSEVFPFYSDPHNLERITPPFLGFRVLGSSTPEIRSGTLIDYRLSLHGVPVRWQSRIEKWEPGRRFVDVQVRGPYKRWRHTHEFEAFEGGTLVRDRVCYELPLGVLGDLAAGGLVARDVAEIFAYRRERLKELLPGTGSGSRDQGERVGEIAAAPTQ